MANCTLLRCWWRLESTAVVVVVVVWAAAARGGRRRGQAVRARDCGGAICLWAHQSAVQLIGRVGTP